MKVDKLGIDLLTHDPVVILKDMEGKRYLPILIGPFEATAIALAMEGTKVPRPLSHDLMKSIVSSLNSRVLRVIIHDIRDNTFYARIILDNDGEPVEIDARPSDSIALALRADAPIFVSEQIVLEETVIDKDAPEDNELKEFRQYVENLKPGDFVADINQLKEEDPEEAPLFETGDMAEAKDEDKEKDED